MTPSLTLPMFASVTYVHAYVCLVWLLWLTGCVLELACVSGPVHACVLSAVEIWVYVCLVCPRVVW